MKNLLLLNQDKAEAKKDIEMRVRVNEEFIIIQPRQSQSQSDF